jgi:hypothetical protein
VEDLEEVREDLLVLVFLQEILHQLAHHKEIQVEQEHLEKQDQEEVEQVEQEVALQAQQVVELRDQEDQEEQVYQIQFQEVL